MDIIFISLFWLTFCVLVAAFANRKGRSAGGFFILSLLLSPLIGFLVALVQPVNEQVLNSRMLQSGVYRKCPHCAEIIKSEAHACKHCGRDIPPLSQEELEAVKSELHDATRTKEAKDKAAKDWAGQKQCSICGEYKDIEAFDYGNRDSRSYCSVCNKIDQKLYHSDGLEAVHSWREEMRQKWKTD